MGQGTAGHVHWREAVRVPSTPPSHNDADTRKKLTLRGLLWFSTLTIPPEYGYGQRQVGPIPAGSTLSMPLLIPSFRILVKTDT